VLCRCLVGRRAPPPPPPPPTPKAPIPNPQCNKLKKEFNKK